ncbi:hypothetical protein BDW02DRAFT_191168 [Decorospora gaudefroyi]|uniref:Uncharacterized protein n=1 Tax=Decorospora gaudefroyi TaxID=184978 RepID=A0A6A5JZ28_9PLEO|nr:hypothetical protein BDW02DRAFT_191168 [Decorospora gaudefroyi]
MRPCWRSATATGRILVWYCSAIAMSCDIMRFMYKFDYLFFRPSRWTASLSFIVREPPEGEPWFRYLACAAPSDCGSCGD